jgi:NAD+ diphosphatase
MPTQPSPIVMQHIRPQLSLDRLGGQRGNAASIDALRAAPSARYLLIADLKFAVVSNEDRTETKLRTFDSWTLGNLGLNVRDAFLLGVGADGAPTFAVSLSAAEIAAMGAAAEQFAPLVDLRSLALQGQVSVEEIAVAGQARALSAWHATQRCCGRCGARTRVRDGGWRRDCRACGQVHFPRSDPAVIMAIIHDDRLLLGHEHRFPEKLYSVLAGFVEPGDDIETAVRREIMEEAGVLVGAVHYVGSQPWPFPYSLMIGCWGEALDDTISLDVTELPEARWVPRSEVGEMLEGRHPHGHIVPPPLSIAHTLIRAFAEGKLGKDAV